MLDKGRRCIAVRTIYPAPRAGPACILGVLWRIRAAIRRGGLAVASVRFQLFWGAGSARASPKPRRLAVLAGRSWSFDEASRILYELCGLRISDYLIRQEVAF
jgi:hypothetical protein